MPFNSKKPLPIKNYRLISGYGMRTIPKYGTHMHKGIDIIATDGNKRIYATEDYQVYAKGYELSMGNFIKLVPISDKSYIIEMFHLESIPIYPISSIIKKGDVIGIYGNTGWSNGEHLHIGVLKNGIYVNPTIYFNV